MAFGLTVVYRLQRGRRPPRRTHAASLRAPRSTFAAAPDPAPGSPAPGGPNASFKPRGVLRGPQGRPDGLAGCRARLEEGVRAQDASKRRRTRYLVRGFEVSRAKTSRAPFQVLRGAIDAARVGAFGKPAGGVARGLSRLPPLKKCRPKQAILPFSDVSSGPARLGVPGGHPRPGSDSFSVVFAPFGALFPPLDPTHSLPWIYAA